MSAAPVRKFVLEELENIGSPLRYEEMFHNPEDIDDAKEIMIHLIAEHDLIPLLKTMKKRDHYTFYHSLDVLIIGCLLMNNLYNEPEKLEDAALGFLLHDIGKMNLPQEFAHLKRKLTVEEFEMVKTHTTEGYQWLLENGFSETIARYALNHHERLDGSGYPYGKTEDDFTISEKCLMVVDVFSALTFDRPHRNKFSVTEAIQILLQEDNTFEMNMIFSLMSTLRLNPQEKTGSAEPAEKFETVVKLHPPKKYTASVDAIINWKRNTLAESITTLTNALVEDDRRAAFELFFEMCDGMSIENIFTNVITRTLKEIDHQYKNNYITKKSSIDAAAVIQLVVDYMTRDRTRKLPMNEGNVLLTTGHSDDCIYKEPVLTWYITENLLKIHNWSVDTQSSRLHKSTLMECIEKNKVNIVGFSITTEESFADFSDKAEAIRKNFPEVKITAAHSSLTAINRNVIDFYNVHPKNFLKYAKKCQESWK
ncbi:HD-GYP domain-containing protein [Alteribacillus sp. HJP-4]|uniref:HD-GYP domain-containing protein n=1 Tax=Alteribacillus sp. HJP-4 TaxID=2775394 RepID=UPI0035CD102B